MRPTRNYQEGFVWEHQLREWRHNPCLMSPLTAGLLFIMMCFWIFTAAMRFPSLVLGYFLAPLLGRFPWVVEFIYPTALGRWFHLSLVKVARRSHSSSEGGGTDKNRGFHSRALETRIEVVLGRVYLHPLPQFLDNLGYLVVCVPPHASTKSKIYDTTNSAPNTAITVSTVEENRLVAFVVDCGDADAVARQVQLISDLHYGKKRIYVQSILSTHKHHDHTAGNRALVRHPDMHGSIKLVFGGAVERVPECNFPVANGDLLPLPKHGNNDMGSLVEVEVIATPAHTRGSVTYALRPKLEETASASAFLFTGDTMFCGGGGVPFEADFDLKQENNASTMTANDFIRAGASLNAIERCFAEILSRSVSEDMTYQVSPDRLLVFPGHEYSASLLARQITDSQMESCKWRLFSPAVFFETASQLYVANHRRSLPQSSGKLLTVPSPIRRELHINPHLRSLQRRGELIISAIRMWHRHFASMKIPESMQGSYGLNSSSFDDRPKLPKSISTQNRWNLDGHDFTQSVFTTLYSADLESVIEGLAKGEIHPKTAARRLQEMKKMMEIPVVGRRPVPGTLPSDKLIYKGLLGFVLLGSAPTAFTRSDGVAMKVLPPTVISSDSILISKKRLISVLYFLGLLSAENEGRRLVAMIDQLWREASSQRGKRAISSPKTDATPDNSEAGDITRYNTVDTEAASSSSDSADFISLGSLKWIIYGVPSARPTWFPKYCIPCAPRRDTEPPKVHPSEKLGLQRHGGELVRHDVFACLLCRGSTGCTLAGEQVEETEDVGENEPMIQRILSSDGDESGPYIELSPHGIQSVLSDV